MHSPCGWPVYVYCLCTSYFSVNVLHTMPHTPQSYIKWKDIKVGLWSRDPGPFLRRRLWMINSHSFLASIPCNTSYRLSSLPHIFKDRQWPKRLQRPVIILSSNATYHVCTTLRRYILSLLVVFFEALPDIHDSKKAVAFFIISKVQCWSSLEIFGPLQV